MQTVADIRLRLFKDFPYYAENALSIRTKDGEIAPLVLNEGQRRFVEAWKSSGRLKGKSALSC